MERADSSEARGSKLLSLSLLHVAAVSSSMTVDSQGMLQERVVGFQVRIEKSSSWQIPQMPSR